MKKIFWAIEVHTGKMQKFATVSSKIYIMRWFLGVADHQMTSPLDRCVFLTIIRFKFLFNLYKSSFRQTDAKFCRFVSTDKFTDNF